MKFDPLPTASDRTGCRTCALRFTSTCSFDQHRVGGYDAKAVGYGRRCLTEAELAAKGYAPTEEGHWRKVPTTDLTAIRRAA